MRRMGVPVTVTLRFVQPKDHAKDRFDPLVLEAEDFEFVGSWVVVYLAGGEQLAIPEGRLTSVTAK